MGTILDEIITQKKAELDSLPSGPLKADREPVSLAEMIKDSNTMAVISEVKRASPSKGDINQSVNPAEQAAKYAGGGADAISVLTDQKFFSGTMEDLGQVKRTVDVPVLNKDFIIDTRQIDNACRHGADVILLIVAALDDAALKALCGHAESLGLDVLVEVHDEAEMERALRIEPEIIGINNRDLKTFTVDIANTEKLLGKYRDSGPLFIAESGIRTREDALRMQCAGARGLLVGETLMTADDPAGKIEELKVEL
ncbi:indole-3-glycerol phosphate synthase [Salinicoccus sediminis]|uniref:Indole-3-glycerol phosphate synthase n=1 Tax=Salinicoccus sediminis TaxID=1432562 RepID=A0A0M2SK75_9STAP|nr:indole-3-glycerol phosphate synthase TrpC [Salinicoccus sediminis]KKK34066.1 indole-3-glycerol phosphate synthase [Salinicoccus sediminis]